ncbi:glucosamine-6-phosphate deaminase [Ruicaihuangia caeni]|uniref:glucosamine-6-phosphate deaminase n=1 Tax=Ruicaihuangia caeni TaxID=3042517 RepID=UPI00338F06C6
MEIVICEDAAEIGRIAASKIIDLVRRKPTAAIGLATGSSPLGIYAELAHAVARGELDMSRAHGFALDEYVGIELEHPQSYYSVIHREVVERLSMDPARVHVPDGRAADLHSACEAYEEAIEQAGGVDLQIVGIGSNGHIGFNEPTSSFGSRTRVKALAPQTRADNARFFDSLDQVPTLCLTQGLGTIMDAREVVLVAQGEHKADAIAAAVEGPMAAVMPASVLQGHRYATVIIDEAAASKLQYTEYYRHAWNTKPERAVSAAV